MNIQISTHSARGGGDKPGTAHRVMAHTISTHSARGGGDICLTKGVSAVVEFQPTPPVGAETPAVRLSASGFSFQPTPPVGAETFGNMWHLRGM